MAHADLLFKLALFSFILVFLSLCAFAVPQADDWCFASSAREHGFLGAIGSWYRTWTGIYTTTGLMSLPIVGADIVLAAPIVSASCFALSLYGIGYLVKTQVGDSCGTREATAIVFSVYLAAMPDPAQGYYWISAATSYLLAICLTAVILALFCDPPNSKGRAPSIGRCFALLVLCLLLAGTHGAIGAAIGGGFVVMAIISATCFRRVNPKLLIGICATGVGVLLVLASPGNEARLSMHQVDRSVMGFAPVAIMELGRFALDWSSTLVIWAASICLISIVRRRGIAVDSVRENMRFPVIFSGATVISALVILPIWAIGAVPGRLMNFAYFIFLLTFFSLVLSGYALLSHDHDSDGSHREPWAWLLPRIALLIALLNSENFHYALKDLAVAKQFHSESTKRFARLESSPVGSNEVVKLASFKSQMRMLQFPEGDFSGDGDFFANRCAATYFGKARIEISPIKN